MSNESNDAALTPFCDRACRITFEQNDGTPLYERLHEQLLVDERAKALRRKLGFGSEPKSPPPPPTLTSHANERGYDQAVCEGGSGGTCNPPQSETPSPNGKKTMTTSEEDSEPFQRTERWKSPDSLLNQQLFQRQAELLERVRALEAKQFSFSPVGIERWKRPTRSRLPRPKVSVPKFQLTKVESVSPQRQTPFNERKFPEEDIIDVDSYNCDLLAPI